MIKVAINGYGRIGRNTLRALYESGRNKDISILAINDLAPANVNAHLTQFDSVHGQFSQKVSLQDDVMIVGHMRSSCCRNATRQTCLGHSSASTSF